MRIALPTGTPAELALPPSATPTGGLVLLPDIMGLRPLFDEHCARLAAEQDWAVCGVELFPGREHLGRDERLLAARDLDDARLLVDVSAAADATGCDAVGIVGFCMGGMFALKSVQLRRFHRTVAFYGMIRVPDEWRGPGQGEPLDALAQGDARSVLAVVGTVDPWTPPDDVVALEATGATVVRYTGADHAFAHDPARDVHRAGDAADAFARAVDWLSA